MLILTVYKKLLDKKLYGVRNIFAPHTICNLKVKIFVYLLFLLLTPIMAYADAVEIEGVYYLLESNEKTAEVTSMPSGKYTGDIVLPEVITYNGEEYRVTSIGDHAFDRCYYLTSIKIPSSVITIGNSAFYNCQGLSSLVIPNSVITLGDLAFAECVGLTSVEIGHSVTSISLHAFRNCHHLQSLIIPDNVKSIENYAFQDCHRLSSVAIGEAVEKIGNFAFSCCNDLKSVDIPNSTIEIGDNAFEICYNLSSVTLGNSVNIIGNGAFSFSNIYEIVIPRSVTSIGLNIVVNCDNLRAIMVENGNPNYDSRDECNAIIETKSNKLIAGCKTTKIPSSINIIGWGAFRDCRNLLNITIPNNVISIEKTAFYGCSSLNSLTIPNSVQNIEECAFWHCTALTDVYCKILNPKEINIDASEKHIFAFSNFTKATLHVPSNKVDEYLSVFPWNQFGSIVGLDETNISQASSNQLAISAMDGEINIKGSKIGETVKVYDAAGKNIASITAVSESTTIYTPLRSGEYAIVKIGEKSFKILIR